MKGDDYHRARHVAQSSTVHNEFYILLANMELQRTDPNDETEEREESEQLVLTHIVDLGGFSLSIYNSLSISDTYLLQEICYSDREPDVQRGGHYMGNQHAEIDQFFKDSVSALQDRSEI